LGKIIPPLPHNYSETAVFPYRLAFRLSSFRIIFLSRELAVYIGYKCQMVNEYWHDILGGWDSLGTVL
jgi:hypothetical protein